MWRLFSGQSGSTRLFRSKPFKALAITSQILLGGHMLIGYGFQIAPSWGISMVPTIDHVDQWLLVSKHYRRGRDVQVGDVVSFRHPVKTDSPSEVVKRVLGMPGDFVLATTPGRDNTDMMQVPAGHCWVVGDNLRWSRDSRLFGPVPLALIRGKVIATYRFWWDWDWSISESPLKEVQKDDERLQSAKLD